MCPFVFEFWKERVAGFLRREDGATTAEYVILLAGVVGISFSVGLSIMKQVHTLSQATESELESIEVGVNGGRSGEDDSSDWGTGSDSTDSADSSSDSSSDRGAGGGGSGRGDGARGRGWGRGWGWGWRNR